MSFDGISEPTPAGEHTGDSFAAVLTPEGELLTDSPFYTPVDPEDLRSLYRDLVLVRRFDTEATALQRQGELGLWAPSLGQEAAQVGAGRAMAPLDMAFPTYREHGVAWCKGVTPEQVLSLFRGTTNGGWDPQEHRFALYTIVIGNQCLHAVGYAIGIQLDGRTGDGSGADAPAEAAICFFGDGATSQGDVNEAFVWGAVTDAPVVFFCQNNQWAISEPSSRQTRIPLYRRADGFGFPGIRVDGNDVLAVREVTRRALDRARRGDGPTLIEAYTYRMGAHTTSDDPTRYRVAADNETWKLRDPLERVRALLLRHGWAGPEFIAQLDQESDDLATRIRSTVRAMPDPDPQSMFDHAYAPGHPGIAGERERFSAYQDSFAEVGPAAGHGRGSR